MALNHSSLPALPCPGCHTDAEGAFLTHLQRLSRAEKKFKKTFFVCLFFLFRKERRPDVSLRAPEQPLRIPGCVPPPRPAFTRCGTYRYCPLVAPGPGRDRSPPPAPGMLRSPSPVLPSPGAAGPMAHPLPTRQHSCPCYPASPVGRTVPGPAGLGVLGWFPPPMVQCETQLAVTEPPGTADGRFHLLSGCFPLGEGYFPQGRNISQEISENN